MKPQRLTGLTIIGISALIFLSGMGAAFDKTSYFTDKVGAVWACALGVLFIGLVLFFIDPDENR